MENLLMGFQVALTWENLLFCLFGVFLGMFTGVLPGIGSLAAVAMLLPLSFHLEPLTALIMLAGVYYGSDYGGATASILLNLPGTPSNAVATLEGYPMAKQGRAGVALFIQTMASFTGGCIGIVILASFTPMISRAALALGPAEYFVIMALGLIAAATISQGSPIKGVAMVVVGLMLGTIGADINSGMLRFTVGISELEDGLSVVIIAMGLFGVTEIIASIRDQREQKITQRITLRSMIPTLNEIKRIILPTLRGAGIGSALGPFPGTGPTIASFLAYAVEKRVASDKSAFGTGKVEGLASPESANNAAAQTGFIPTLGLAIPGSPAMAIMLGALMIHGITPGPLLITQNPDLFWGVIASFWIGNLFLLVINLPMIGLWVSILRIPYVILYPAIICLICIGVFSINNNMFDIVLVLGVGLFGYLLRVLDFEPAPLLMGFILGPLMEENLRRELLINGGNPWGILQRPISGTLIAISLGLVALYFVMTLRKRGRSNLQSREQEGNA